MVARCPCEFSLSYPFRRRIFAIIPTNYIPCLSYTLHIGPWSYWRSVYPFLLLHVVQKTTSANHPIINSINMATPNAKNQCMHFPKTAMVIKPKVPNWSRKGMGWWGPPSKIMKFPSWRKTWNPVGDLVWNGIAFMVPPSGSGNHFRDTLTVHGRSWRWFFTSHMYSDS